MTDPTQLGALEAGAAIAAGRLTSEALTLALLDRIALRDDAVRAWSHLDPEAALAEARARDAEPARGPLHGVPVGVKDIVDTHDMPTTCGSPIYAGHRPAADAACVALLRQAGMVVLGKTVTTEFAMRHPGPTRNPHRPEHTPGGSSSGSAAAVGDHQVPLGIGTQTAGSIVRPAAYCGAVGYKPSWGTVPRAGVKLIAESLDSIGAIARSVPDAAAFVDAMAGWPVRPLPVRESPPRLGLCRTPAWPTAEPAAVAALDEAAHRLRDAGAEIVECDLPSPFEEALAAHLVLMTAEGTRMLAHEIAHHGDRLSQALRDYIREGATCTAERYRWALDAQRRCRAALDETFADLDGLLTPAAPGEAPARLDYTGDPALNRIWTFAGVPCVTVPGLTGPGGLSIGTQIVGALGDDPATLGVAEWAHRHLAA